MYFRSSSERSNKVYYLGEYGNGDTVDVASKYANYSQLTNANFIIAPTNTISGSFSFEVANYYNKQWGSPSQVSSQAISSTPTLTYDSTQGKLVVGLTVGVSTTGVNRNNVDDHEVIRSNTGTGSFPIRVKVYLVEGTIDTL